MPTTCWGVQRHHRAVPAPVPRSAQLWGAPVSAHKRPGRSLSTAGETASGVSVELVIDRSCPGDLCCSLLPCLWVVFQACRFQYHRYWDATEWLRLWHSLLQTAGRDLLRLMPPVQVRVAFTAKAQTPPKRRKVIKWPLIGFTPALNFRETGVCLQLSWAHVCSLCDFWLRTVTANLLTAGLAARVGTSSLALKVCSQTPSSAEFQVSCVITELE